MNYQQCLRYLEKRGEEVLSMRPGLDNIRRLCELLGNPQERFPSLLVAGTNGKGSVARFLHGVLASAGYRCGLYTSPHLVDLRERFVVGGKAIEEEVFAELFTRVVGTIERAFFGIHPTYFECLTATAFLYLAQEEVEVAVLEVGMGGRLDSTNVVDPVLSVVTPIGLDHQRYLGYTLEAIAREKAGIFRPGRPALSAPQKAVVTSTLREEAERRGTFLEELQPREILSVEWSPGRYRLQYHGVSAALSVFGRQQVENAALAVRAVELLGERGWKLPLPKLQEGLARTLSPGVLQRVSRQPLVFLDGGHNLDAGRTLVQFLKEHTPAPRSLVFSMMKDKDIGGYLGLLEPLFGEIFLTRLESPRGASLEALKECCPRGHLYPRAMEAYEKALEAGATVVVAGSFYLVGEIMKGLKVPARVLLSEREAALS